ncbi:MAG: translation initiation factor IF-2 [Candidatus Geothermincolales bacterium]
MAGIRVHQLAKEIGIPYKELVSHLHAMGLEVNNPLSSLDEKTVERVRKDLLGKIKGQKGGVSAEIKEERAKKVTAAPGVKETEKKGRIEEGQKAVKPTIKAAPQPAKKDVPSEVASRESREKLRVRPREEKRKPPAPGRTKDASAVERESRPVKEARETRPKEKRPAQPEVVHGRDTTRDKKPAETLEPQEQATRSVAPTRKKIRVQSGTTVREFAQIVGKTPADIIKLLMDLGEMVNINQAISDEALIILGDELGFEVELKAKKVEEIPVPEEDKPESLRPRPPVVTVMGHVDHGKTSLLDAIRKTSVTAQEFGGITQHIGASVVEFQGKSITFIDTPGHESFTALRARGAQVTDIAVLVVAADDGVMPQTIEAINHARAAEVPILVAVNKIDKPDANPTRVRQQLTEFNLVPEEWGGDTIFVDVSAKEGTNLDHLLEMILLLAEVHELKANPNAPASGNIIEAKLDKGRGPVATVIVKRGTLRRGDAVVAGKTYGKVRALIDDKEGR